MSLISDLTSAVAQAENPHGCSVCTALTLLLPADAVSLRKALASPLGQKKLNIILRKNGIAVGVPSINRHRSEGHS